MIGPFLPSDDLERDLAAIAGTAARFSKNAPSRVEIEGTEFCGVTQESALVWTARALRDVLIYHYDWPL